MAREHCRRCDHSNRTLLAACKQCNSQAFEAQNPERSKQQTHLLCSQALPAASLPQKSDAVSRRGQQRRRRRRAEARGGKEEGGQGRWRRLWRHRRLQLR